MIRIHLNGEARDTPAASVAELLANLEIDPRSVVVELNREIIRRPALQETRLREGDEIELVHFVGGG